MSKSSAGSGPKQGVEDARRNLPALLERANRGQTVVITKHGKPFAAIGPVQAGAGRKSPTGLSLGQLRGTGKGLWGRDSSAWIRKERKEW